MANRLFGILLARPRLAAVVLLLASLLALIGAARLQLEHELPSLLPNGSSAAEGYQLFLTGFGGLEKVFVLVRGSDSGDEAERLIHASSALEAELRRSPEVAAVRIGIDAEDEQTLLRYVLARAPLITPVKRLPDIAKRLRPETIRHRVEDLRAALTTPSGGLRSLTGRYDPLGFSDLLPPLSSEGSMPIDPVSGAFLATDGSAALIALVPARGELDPEGGRALLSALERAYASVRAELGADLRFAAVGGPLYAAWDEALLRADLEKTIGTSALACAILLFLALGGVSVPLAALVALTIGLLWAAGWLGWVLGQVTAVSLAFATVLIGLGIDYVIHGGARYRQSRLTGSSPVAALEDTFRRAGPPLVTSALTTAAAFATLSLAHFRPLREIGQLVASGVLFILLAATLLAIASRLFPHGPRRRSGALWRSLEASAGALAGLATRFPRRVLWTASIVSALALWSIAGLRLDPALEALRPEGHPAAEAEALLSEHFNLGLDTTTLMVRGKSLDQALARAGDVAEMLREELGDEAGLTSPHWLGRGSPQRLAALRALPFAEAAEHLEIELRRAGLAPAAFEPGLTALRAFASGRDPAPPPREAWPSELAGLTAQQEGAAWAALRLRLPPQSWPQGPPAKILTRLEKAAPGSRVASAPALGTELGQIAGRDVSRLGLAALAAVLLVVATSFRGHPASTLLALLPPVCGLLWSLGLWAALGSPLDLLGLVVAPVLLGIGIDDGLHALHGARQRPEAGLAGAARDAGPAMCLTTLTTCAGFGSLALSSVPGLRTAGVLVTCGSVGCLLTTLLVLPALETRWKKQP